MTKKGMYHLREEDDVNAKVANLTRKVEGICGICETNEHQTQDCQTIPVFQEVLREQANAINAPIKDLFLLHTQKLTMPLRGIIPISVGEMDQMQITLFKGLSFLLFICLQIRGLLRRHCKHSCKVKLKLIIK